MGDLDGVLWLHEQHQPDAPQRLGGQLLVLDVKEVLQSVLDLVSPFLLTDAALLQCVVGGVCRWAGQWEESTEVT